MTLCEKCDSEFSVSELLVCSVCLKELHYVCCGISEKNFKKFNTTRKKAWRCSNCKEQNGSPRIDETKVCRELKFLTLARDMKVESSSVDAAAPRPVRSAAIAAAAATSKQSKPNRLSADAKKPDGTKSSSSRPKTHVSLLKPSVDCTIESVDHVIKALDNATPEVHDIIKKECYVIYECKMCRNLFRSIVNFISHKRGYCKGRFRHHVISQNDEIIEHSLLVTGSKGKLTTQRTTSKADLCQILERCSKTIQCGNVDPKALSVLLKEIPATSEAFLNSTPQITNEKTDNEPEVTENANKQKSEKLSEDIDEKTPVLGPDGRLIGSPTPALDCLFCSDSYFKIEDLEYHTKSVHGGTKYGYFCPCCKKYFANPWSVYRHLRKVHKKTPDQISQLRSEVQKKQPVSTGVDVEKGKEETKTDVLTNGDKKMASQVKPKPEVKLTPPTRPINGMSVNSSPPTLKPPNNAPSPWPKAIDDMEWLERMGNIQHCPNCSKKFDRKVALVSHAFSCHKRYPVALPVPKRAFHEHLSPDVANVKKARIQVRTFYNKGSSPVKSTDDASSCRSTSSSSSIASWAEHHSLLKKCTVPLTKLPDQEINSVVSRYQAGIKRSYNDRNKHTENGDTTTEHSDDEEGSQTKSVLALDSDEDASYTNGIDSDLESEDIQMNGKSSQSSLRSSRNSSESSLTAVSEESAPDTHRFMSQETTSENPSSPEWLNTTINKHISPSAESNTCLICNKAFPRLAFVKRHVAEVHLKLFKFKCLVASCESKFFLRTDINNHIEKEHHLPVSEDHFERLIPKRSRSVIQNGRDDDESQDSGPFSSAGDDALKAVMMTVIFGTDQPVEGNFRLCDQEQEA